MDLGNKDQLRLEIKELMTDMAHLDHARNSFERRTYTLLKSMSNYLEEK